MGSPCSSRSSRRGGRPRATPSASSCTRCAAGRPGPAVRRRTGGARSGRGRPALRRRRQQARRPRRLRHDGSSPGGRHAAGGNRMRHPAIVGDEVGPATGRAVPPARSRESASALPAAASFSSACSVAPSSEPRSTCEPAARQTPATWARPSCPMGSPTSDSSRMRSEAAPSRRRLARSRRAPPTCLWVGGGRMSRWLRPSGRTRRGVRSGDAPATRSWLPGGGCRASRPRCVRVRPDEARRSPLLPHLQRRRDTAISPRRSRRRIL